MAYKIDVYALGFQQLFLMSVNFGSILIICVTKKKAFILQWKVRFIKTKESWLCSGSA